MKPNDPAYPQLHDSCQRANETETWPGLTARALAAIKLRVPDSGEPWLDAMIQQSRRLDIATAAMQGLISSDAADGWSEKQTANASFHYADALLAAEKETGT